MKTNLYGSKRGLFFIIGAIRGCVIGACTEKKKLQKKQKIIMERADKFYGYFKIFDRWFSIKKENKTLETYFKKNQFHRVALYGMGIMGNHLLSEMQTYNEVRVIYGIDQKGISLNGELRVYGNNEILPPVDVIVVTAVFDFDVIKKQLSSKASCPIVSLWDVVYSLDV